jgi:uncharacterized membrane protein YgdD (TMEM256/DUF423 family)
VSARIVSAIAALLCGLSVALGAYAAHAADPVAGRRFAIAALFAFAHGLALLVLRTRAGRLALGARAALLLGVLLFAGSLAWAGAGFGPARFAPFGGTLLMLGWLLAAIDFLRKD